MEGQGTGSSVRPLVHRQSALNDIISLVTVELGSQPVRRMATQSVHMTGSTLCVSLRVS